VWAGVSQNRDYIIFIPLSVKSRHRKMRAIMVKAWSTVTSFHPSTADR